MKHKKLMKLFRRQKEQQNAPPQSPAKTTVTPATPPTPAPSTPSRSTTAAPPRQAPVSPPRSTTAAPPRPTLAKAAPETAESGYTVSKEGKVLRKQALRLWEGDIPQFIEPNDTPDIHWRGGRIHLGLLCQCLLFFRHGVDKFDSEVQLRLAYNESTGEWCAVSFPQKVRRGALAVEEIKTELLTPTQREQRDEATSQMYQQGFTLNGTIHSHCNASAFQSGTDEKDETNQPGVHITLGHVSQDEIEVHGRVTYRGVQYPIHWNEWLDEITGMPDDSDKFVLTLDKARVDKHAYPEQWNDTLYETPVVSHVNALLGWPANDYASDYGFGHGYSYRHGYQPSSRGTEWEKRVREGALSSWSKPGYDVNNTDDMIIDDDTDPLDSLSDFLPDRKQFDTPEAWMTAACSVLWKSTSAINDESMFDAQEFDNLLEYEPIPIPGAFSFFRSRLAEELILMLTNEKHLDEFDTKVAESLVPFLDGAAESLCEFIFGEMNVSEVRVYGTIGVRPSDNELVMRIDDLERTITEFLESFFEAFGDGLFNGITESLTPTDDLWPKKTSKEEQEERVALMWAMLQLIAHHTDLKIPGVTRPQRPADTLPPLPKTKENPPNDFDED